jgi:hypothetical protein
LKSKSETIFFPNLTQLHTMTEPVKVNVTNVKAADPSLGFGIKITNVDNTPAAFGLTIALTDADDTIVHSSSIEISATKDTVMNFIMPFGDALSRVGKTYQYAITAKRNGQSVLVENGSGSIQAGPGRFYPVELRDRVEVCASVVTQPEKVLWAGNAIASQDGKHIGVMQFDGSFAIYQIADTSNLPLRPVATPTKSNAALGRTGLFVSAADGFAYTFEFDANQNLCLIAKSSTPVAGGYLVILSGQFCMITPGGQSVPISFALV